MMRLFCLCALLCSTPAFAGEHVMVLQWAGSSLQPDDGKLQRVAASALHSKSLTFESADALFPDGAVRDARLALIEALMKDPDACRPVLRPQHVEALASWATDHGPLWVAIPVDGKAKSLRLWRWSAEENALVLEAEACSKP